MATELSLKGKAPFPRTLSISFARHHVTLSLYVESQKRLAYAIAKFADCYLDKRGAPALWIGSTAFDVTEAEAQKIRTTYEPLGLHIAEDELPKGAT